MINPNFLTDELAKEEQEINAIIKEKRKTKNLIWPYLPSVEIIPKKKK